MAQAAVAAAPSLRSHEQWEARALALAEARHLDGTARWLREDAAMRTYWAPSGDRRGAGHLVVVFPRTRHIACRCSAGAFGKPCGHAGAVIHAERAREQALARLDTDVMESWRRGFDW